MKTAEQLKYVSYKCLNVKLLGGKRLVHDKMFAITKTVYKRVYCS